MGNMMVWVFVFVEFLWFIVGNGDYGIWLEIMVIVTMGLLPIMGFDGDNGFPLLNLGF